MPVLYFFESIRTPFLDTLMSLLTHLGEETFFLAIAVTVFWCIDKKEGYYLLSVGFIGTVVNQFLKITCRISRPWVQDPNFTIVESAREQATGYSFPSGHTQSATGVFASLSNWNKKNIIRIICYILIITVAVTRLYLGVHTPLDVGVSLVIGLVLPLILYPVFRKSNEKTLWKMWIIMAAVAFAFVLYVKFFPFPIDIEVHNLDSAIKNSYTIFGASLGVLAIYYLDNKYVHFETKAPLLIQIIKTAAGLALLLLVKSVLKAPLYAAFGNEIGQAARYFILVLVAGFVWPMCFKYLKLNR